MQAILALDKWARLGRIIRQNGGIINTLGKMWRMDTLKEGEYKGCDSFGNKYYENPYYMLSRNRWVEYNPSVKWEYDASQVTSFWYGWLHHKTDRLPCYDRAKACLLICPWTCCWLKHHEENLTGTDRAYYPYSTVPRSIFAWDGKNNQGSLSYNGESVHKAVLELKIPKGYRHTIPMSTTCVYGVMCIARRGFILTQIKHRKC